nr:ABC-three component system middle component 7 [Aminipila luticellarii]
MPVIELFDRVRMSLKDATDFISVMDCLYALRAIDINDDEEVFLCLLK